MHAISDPRWRTTRVAVEDSAAGSAYSSPITRRPARDHAARCRVLGLGNRNRYCPTLCPCIAWCSRPGHPGMGLEHALSNWLSRVVVAAILVPIVLGVVYLGGWYLFAFVAVACVIALHEYWLLGRALSPLAPAGYIGAALALVGAQL